MDLPVVDLCIKFFNTYLRASINLNEVRTVYNVLYQYRKLAEFIIEYGKEMSDEKAKVDALISFMDNIMFFGYYLISGQEENELETRALKIAKFLRYYG